MFISNNSPSFHLWRKENSVKHRKDSKYYGTDRRCHVNDESKNLDLLKQLIIGNDFPVLYCFLQIASDLTTSGATI